MKASASVHELVTFIVMEAMNDNSESYTPMEAVYACEAKASRIIKIVDLSQ